VGRSASACAHQGSRAALKPTRNRRLGNLETEFQQLAVDTRCSPSRAFSSHAKDQHPNLFVYRLATSKSPSSGEPLQVEPKASAMPLNYSSWGRQDKGLLPSLPEPSQNYPEQFLSVRHSGETADRAAQLGKQAEQQAVYANRRRVRGEYGKVLLRRRGELVERSFAHCYETGGMRRCHLRASGSEAEVVALVRQLRSPMHGGEELRRTIPVFGSPQRTLNARE
jgi:hypothetical protein